jgi:RHS repeat-associated protein
MAVEGHDIVAYNGRNHHIVTRIYDDGALDRTRYFYYSESWQVLEERANGTASGDVQLQYVWGLQYVDSLICRDRTVSGPLDERVYALQDTNFNVSAIVSAASAVLERYRYSPYGARTVLNVNFTVHTDPASGSYAFAVAHQGLMHDDGSGLVHNRARVLHPLLGTFSQRDPLGYVDGMNLSAYVRNNPLGYNDPFGLTSAPAAPCPCKLELVTAAGGPTSPPTPIADSFGWYHGDLWTSSHGCGQLPAHTTSPTQ